MAIAVIINGAQYSIKAGQIAVKACQIYGTLAVGALACQAAPKVARGVKTVANHCADDIKFAWSKTWNPAKYFGPHKA